MNPTQTKITMIVVFRLILVKRENKANKTKKKTNINVGILFPDSKVPIKHKINNPNEI